MVIKNLQYFIADLNTINTVEMKNDSEPRIDPGMAAYRAFSLTNKLFESMCLIGNFALITYVDERQRQSISQQWITAQL